MKKYLLYGGMFLGSFLVINVGMYFLLSATQPQSTIGTVSDSLAIDSLAALHGDSTHTETDTSAHYETEPLAEAHTDSATHPETAPIEHATETAPEPVTEVAPDKPADQTESAHADSVGEIADADVPAGDPSGIQLDSPVSSKEIAKLAKMMEGMKPIEAAAIAERLPDETIVQLVLRMKSRAGAKMMAALPVPIAASVAARMAELSGVGG